MKNLLYFFLLSFVATVIISCVKEGNITALTDDVQIESVENRDATVWICHKADGNNPHAIYVDENAVEAHLGHGDVLLDVDGDGYTAANACGEGSMDDCDDEDAAVNPGATEVPYDGIDNDCDPSTPDDDLDGDGYPLATDCDDADAAVNPGVEEICGDEIDNNCDGNADEGCFGNCTLCNFIDDLLACNACWEYTGIFGCGDLGLFTDCGNGYVNIDGCDWGCNSPIPGVPTTIGDPASNAACESALKAALPQCGRMIDVELSPKMQEMVLERIANLKGK
jgi:hypothetical protein